MTGQTLGAPSSPIFNKQTFVYNTGDQPATSGSYLVALFDSEGTDDLALHSTSSQTDRLTIPAGCDGRYLLFAHAYWSARAGGRRWVEPRVNGSAIASIAQAPPDAVNSLPMMMSFPVDLVAGDYVQLALFQDSGNSINAIGSTSAGSPGAATWLKLLGWG